MTVPLDRSGHRPRCRRLVKVFGHVCLNDCQQYCVQSSIENTLLCSVQGPIRLRGADRCTARNGWVGISRP